MHKAYERTPRDDGRDDGEASGDTKPGLGHAGDTNWEGDTKSGFLLSSDELREIEDGAVRIQAHGGRYAEAAESMTNL